MPYTSLYLSRPENYAQNYLLLLLTSLHISPIASPTVAEISRQQNPSLPNLTPELGAPFRLQTLTFLGNLHRPELGEFKTQT